VVGLSPHQADMGVSSLDLSNRGSAVADSSMDPNMRIRLPKFGKKNRKQMFAGDGTCGELQFADDGRLRACDFFPSGAMEFENSLNETVKLSARIGQRNTTATTLEDALSKRLLRD